MHVEAVSTAVGRAELLCAIMLLGVALVATGDEPPSGRARFAMMALAAAALGSKEGGVVAPAIAFAAAWAVPRQRDHARAWALGALAGVVPLLALRVIVLGAIGGDPAHPVFGVAGRLVGVKLALSILPRTAWSLLVPATPPIDLAPSLAESLAPDPARVILGIALAAAAIASLVAHLRRPSLVTLGACFAIATLAPTANVLFPSGVVLAGRTLFAPSIGIALIAGALVAHAMARGSIARRAAGVVAGAWIVAAASIAVREIGVWHDADRLGAAMMARQPENYRSHMYVAEIARGRGEPAIALPHYLAAARLFPRDAYVLYSAGAAALAASDTASAIEWLDRAIDAAPDHWQARTRRVKVAMARGDSALALALLDEGVRRNPEQRVWREWKSRLGNEPRD